METSNPKPESNVSRPDASSTYIADNILLPQPDDRPDDTHDWFITEELQARIASVMADLAAGKSLTGKPVSPRVALAAARTLTMLGNLVLEQRNLDRLREQAREQHERQLERAEAQPQIALEDVTPGLARPRERADDTTRLTAQERAEAKERARQARARRERRRRHRARQSWPVTPSQRRAVLERIVGWADPSLAPKGPDGQAESVPLKVQVQAGRVLAGLMRLELKQQRIELREALAEEIETARDAALTSVLDGMAERARARIREREAMDAAEAARRARRNE